MSLHLGVWTVLSEFISTPEGFLALEVLAWASWAATLGRFVVTLELLLWWDLVILVDGGVG